MHHDLEIIPYIARTASDATVSMISLVARSGFPITDLSDDDYGVSLQSHGELLVFSATTTDDWQTGSFALRGVDGTSIAHFAILWDEEYLKLVLSMIRQIANEFVIRLQVYS